VALAHHPLVAWQRADDRFLKLHQLSLKAFPAFEKYEPGGQLRRSAFSVPVNIVEGFATKYRKRRLNFPKRRTVIAGRGRLLHPRGETPRVHR
jgi:hypothetical protein